MEAKRKGRNMTKIMGVVNLSSESFYRGSYYPPEQLPDIITKMVDDGADIVDMGARSTAPGSPVIGVDEELARMKRAMESLQDPRKSV
jgi:dihydropteroate synthase